MESFYTSLALVSAGVALAMALVFYALTVRRYNRTYLIFATVCTLLVLFYLSPPLGFILNDTPPYEIDILIKRIFIFSYYGILPWFLISYTGYDRRWPAYVISLSAIICYFIMWQTTNPTGKPMWAIGAVITFGMLSIFGITVARWQYRQGEKLKAKWLTVVMGVFSLLFLMTAVNQLSDGSITRLFNMELFFPIHFHLLFFTFMMGQRLVEEVMEKSALEKKLQSSESRWHTFMVNAPFLIVELDSTGSVIFMNDNVKHMFAYNHQANRQHLNELLLQIFNKKDGVHMVRWPLRIGANDEVSISWSNFTLFDASGKIQSVISIGRDITAEEKARELAEFVKAEQLKEKLILKENFSTSHGEIVGSSEALAYALQKATQVAVTNAPVLLEGETGVGKELFANLIHSRSPRSDKPFVKMNCGALSKELIEDELFGHERGAFTSAHQARKGRFELAHGGTLFLDEIGELPLDMQPKLLRVLQTGEFERVGGQKTIKVDVRILAATNRNLSAEVKQGGFRSDLYYRLNVFPITIPALRKRKEDLPLLINYFISSECKKYNKTFDDISSSGMRRLLDYDWPGNIRELRNVIEHAVISCEGNTLRFDAWWGHEEVESEETQMAYTLHRVERDHILEVIRQCNWKINGKEGAAEMLGMNPNTLRSRMKRLGITRPEA